ncbi:hypothetical protein HHL28_15210 [Aerophototrophica crusticola]|uniref:Uncharacterized protein n=1 Tax=Aerophototrophica crusticola TaxID=1709002 RepID=A0A858R9D5_9PROT|nr:hypothetical protein HHL28_15210 [Rhodospirillaceae bacterium B3]
MRVPTLAALALLAATPALAQAEPPLTDALMKRYGAACLESKQANAGKPQSVESLRGVDLDAIPRKHGFKDAQEVMAIGLRVMNVESIQAVDPETLKMLLESGGPDMKEKVAAAERDAPAVTANPEAVKACKAG